MTYSRYHLRFALGCQSGAPSRTGITIRHNEPEVVARRTWSSSDSHSMIEGEGKIAAGKSKRSGGMSEDREMSSSIRPPWETRRRIVPVSGVWKRVE